MGESRIVDVLGLHTNDNDIPHVLFPVRAESCHHSLRSAVGDEIIRRLVTPRGGHVPQQRDSFRVEGIGPAKLVEIAKSLGVMPEDTHHHPDTDPEHLIKKLSRQTGVRIVEVNDVGYE